MRAKAPRRAGGCLYFLLCVLTACTAFESPRKQAADAVERWAATEARLPLQDGRNLTIPAGRMQVSGLDAFRLGGGAIEAFGQVSLEGRVGEIPISYLGNERIDVLCTRTCELQGAPLDRLREVMELLLTRRESLESGEMGKLEQLATDPAPVQEEAFRQAAQRRPAAWFIRVEGDEAVVGEADAAGRQKRLLLRKDERGWRFQAGLP